MRLHRLPLLALLFLLALPIAAFASERQETAILAGGCFWGVQAVYQHVEGVERARSGYSGGTAESAHYQIVSSGRTGHAEAVEIVYDPEKISFATLLDIFFKVVHDPTEIDRQGPDIGRQYRSAIVPVTAEQARIAAETIARLDKAGTFAAPIATRIEADGGFYPAEAYHQDFLARHPTHPYIVVNDQPKILALQKTFPALYRARPALESEQGAR